MMLEVREDLMEPEFVFDEERQLFLTRDGRPVLSRYFIDTDLLFGRTACLPATTNSLRRPPRAAQRGVGGRPFSLSETYEKGRLSRLRSDGTVTPLGLACYTRQL